MGKFRLANSPKWMTWRTLSDDAVARDPLAASFARVAEKKQALRQRAGGSFGVTQVARLLDGISRQAVDKRRAAQQLVLSTPETLGGERVIEALASPDAQVCAEAGLRGLPVNSARSKN